MNGENQTKFSTPVPTLDKTIEQYNSLKQRLNKEKGEQMTIQRFTNMENNLSVSVNSNNEKIKKQGNIASRTGLVAQMISEEAAKHGKDYSTMTDGEILNTYKSKNPNRAGVIDAFINSEQDPYDLKKRMGWSNTPDVQKQEPVEETFMDKAKTSIVGPFARALGALGEGLYGAGEGLANIPNRAKEFSQWQADRGYVDQEGKKPDTNLYQKIKWFGRLAGTLGQMVGDVAGGALMGAADGFTTNQEQAAIKDSVAEVAAAVINSESGEKVQKMYNSLSEEQKQELGDWFTILDGLTDLPLTLGGGKVAKEAIKQGAKGLENQAIKQGVKQLDNVIEGANTAVKNYKVNTAVENLGKNTAKAEKTAGRIIQGDIDAQKEAVNALKIVDTKNVKTYDDLNNAIDKKSTEIAKAVDKILAEDKAKYPGAFTRLEEIADGVTEPIDYTPAKDAIGDLTELYEKLGDKKGLAEMSYWQGKLDSEGLTLKELNDLAKKHGIEFKKKAYNKDGTPKFSDVGVKFETNRKNLKEYVRDLLPDERTKNLDRAYHELIDTQGYVDKMAEKVNTLTQKLADRNIFQKIGGKAGDLFNLATGGSVKAFASKLIPAVGNKLNDAIDMEKELPKLLSKLDDLNRKIDLAKTPKEAEEVAKILEDTFK